MSAATVVSESIVGEETWDAAGSPYMIVAPTTVEAGASVSVMPGAEVLFSDDPLRILGSLIVRGSAAATATLRSDLTDANLSSAPRLFAFGGTIDMKDALIEGLGQVMGFDGAQILVERTAFRRMGTGGVAVYGAFASIRDSSFEQIGGHTLVAFGSDGVDSNLSVSRSSIEAGPHFGLYVEDGQSVEARNNFWGHASGPYHPSLNSAGQGARIYGSADIFPFLAHDPQACCSSVLFLPGLKASRLYLDEEGDENRLWEPNRDRDLDLLGMNADGESLQATYTKPGDVLGEAIIEGLGPNIYRSFIDDMDSLVSDGRIEDWEPVSYDWRLSPDELLASDGMHSIMSALYRLASSSRTGRVAIVAHSNGGIIAKRLMQRLEAEVDAALVDRLIFVAVPQSGTPQAIGSLLHGFDEGIPFLASAKASRKLGSNMPAAYNLLPSAAYVAMDSRPLVLVHATSGITFIKKMRDAFGASVDSTSELSDFLLGSEGRSKPKDSDLTSPSVLNAKLLADAASLHGSIDGWTPPLGIELIQIAGWGRDTVSGIEYGESAKNGRSVLKYKPVLVPDGDGTVTMGSAWALPVAPNVERFEIDLQAAGKGLARDRYHADMLEVPELRAFVRSIILRDPTLITTIGILRRDSDAALHEAEARKRIFLYSPNHALRVAGDSDASDIDQREFGEVSYVSVPESGGSGPSIVIEYDPEDDEDREEDGPPSVSVDIDDDSFVDVPVATTSVITIDLGDSASSTPSLDIDDDGDGDPDRVIGPTQPQAVTIPLVSEAPRSGGRSGGRRRIATSSDILILLDEPHVSLPMESPQTFASHATKTPDYKYPATSSIHVEPIIQSQASAHIAIAGTFDLLRALMRSIAIKIFTVLNPNI